MFTAWIVVSSVLSLLGLAAGVVGCIFLLDEGAPSARGDWLVLFVAFSAPFWVWAWPVIIPMGLIVMSLYTLVNALRASH